MKRLIGVLLLVLAIPGCWQGKKAPESPTFLIQCIAQSPEITQLIAALSLEANQIIRQELGLGDTCKDEFFLPKQVQRITLYYAVRITDQSYVVSALEPLLRVVACNLPRAAGIALDSAFFGDHADELVLMIRDPQQEIEATHNRIEQTMHALHAAYEQSCRHDLYDLQQSERFPFVPHMGLGRLRTGAIATYVADETRRRMIIERIKGRIQAAVHLLLSESRLSSEPLVFEKIVIMDPGSREQILQITGRA